MSLFRAELHIHSCLSPCADEDMTPCNLAGMASLEGIGIAALTDHNTAANCPAFFEACHRYGITPLGDMVSTLTLLLQGTPEVDIHFSHTLNGGEVSLDTGQMREVLGPDIPLNSPEVLGWVKESLLEGYRALGYVF